MHPAGTRLEETPGFLVLITTETCEGAIVGFLA